MCRIFLARFETLVGRIHILCEGRKVNLDESYSDWNKAVNDYTLVIQEFFHSRVDSYLKKIGFHVFGIKHYWARFEFAKSRGQIHLHLLGNYTKRIQTRRNI
jgi:hypothetical protein